MLIEISVSNFRSFKDKQTFSMVAAPRLQKKENHFPAGALGEKLPNLLKVVAIYGPNASGKSNLLLALDAFRVFAHQRPSSTPTILPVQPFRFDTALQDKPSRFEIHFIQDHIRYQFEFAATQSRIHEERLICYPRGKETLLYSRTWNGKHDIYDFGLLEGTKELHATWANLTSSQVLFITQAVANSSDDLLQLRSPLKWLQAGFTVVSSEMRPWANASQQVAKRAPELMNRLATFLQKVDVPVLGIRFDKKSPDGGMLDSNDDAPTTTTLTHNSSLGAADFDFDEESSGTKNLIGFWLPWMLVQDNHAKEYRVLAVDELDSSLHPKIVASLVSQHIKSGNSTQLIFTTHDTHLMDTKLMRRDQFWLTERNSEGATQLRSIHDFVGRDNEDIEKRYYEGRYRSLPLLGES
ncbi:MAG: ATP-binding protein [Herminiimonas sp.]|uniref:AAA family ATPase n=1 Tax=Herminiimonas sp. TaxID=1926289 RepID=UPI0027196CBE|nr:ATP-binding protein [Herminiimonas sp.]MDO9420011.1 ATP-binding protein [Herminiimonas sp.]